MDNAKMLHINSKFARRRYKGVDRSFTLRQIFKALHQKVMNLKSLTIYLTIFFLKAKFLAAQNDSSSELSPM